MLEKNSPSVIRKSDRLKKNITEDLLRKTDGLGSPSAAHLKRSERGNSRSPLKLDKRENMTGVKVGMERVSGGDSEDVASKRRKLDARSFRSLFRKSSNAAVDSSTRTESKSQSKDGPRECDTKFQEDSSLSASLDNCKKKRRIIDYIENDDVEKHEKFIQDHMDVTSGNENQKEVTCDKGSGCAKQSSPVIYEDVIIPSEVLNTESESDIQFEASNALHDTKKSLHRSLKPGLWKLCELLNLSEDVKKMAEWFLEYVMENQHVAREPVTMLQAFQMSVCWIAASLQKQKVNCQEHLALARSHLNFCCSAEDTDYMYLKMVLFKELFIRSFLGDTSNDHERKSVFQDSYISKDSLVGLSPVTSKIKPLIVFDAEKLLFKTTKQINKKIRERMKVLVQSQRKESEELQQSSDEEKAQLEQGYKVEAAVVRTIHAHNLSVAAEKLKVLEEKHSKRLEEHSKNLNFRFKCLEDKHSSEKDKENELTHSWKNDIVIEQIELLSKLTHKALEDDEHKCDSTELVVLDSPTKCRTLEDQSVLNGQPCVLAEKVEDSQSTNPAESLPLPPVSSEAGNTAASVDLVISTSAKFLPGDSASISSETGQVASEQAATFVDITSYIKVPKSSSFYGFPQKIIASELTVEASPGKKLHCVTSQQLSASADLIPGIGLLNPLTMDANPALSSDKEVGVSPHSEVPTMGHSVSLPLSPAALDKEVDNSLLVSSLETDNSLPPSQRIVKAPAAQRNHGIPFSVVAPGFEQSEFHVQLGQSVLPTTTDQCNVDPNAISVHPLLATVNQPELPSSTISSGSKNTHSGIQLSPIANEFVNVDYSATIQPPTTEGQPQFPSISVTTESDISHPDIQLELLSHAANGHFNVEPTTTEPEHQLLATEKQPDSAITPICEQVHSDSQLDESSIQSANQTFVEPPTAGAIHQLPALTEGQPELHSSTIILESEQSQNGIQLDQSLLCTTTGHPVPSAGEAVCLLLATEGENELSSPAVTTCLGKSQSDILFDPILCKTAMDNYTIDPLGADEMPLLPVIEEQIGLPPTILRSEQSDSDSQLGHPTTDNSNIEPSAPLLPLVSSSNQNPLSLRLPEELPSREVGTGLNADAIYPSPSPPIVSVSCVTPTCTAVSQSPLISGRIAVTAVSDFHTTLISGPTVPYNVPACMPMISEMDPLQSELERIQKEEDDDDKKYKDMKQMFGLKCENEIEDVVTQIRKKYETKNMELDAAMKYRKNELDAYRSKVCMNKMLAEIFRTKCMEPKDFKSSGMPQDNVQNQLRSHRHLPEAGTQPTFIANTSPAVQTSGNLQGTYNSVPSTHPPVLGVLSTTPTTRNMLGTQIQLRPSGTLAASSQNYICPGGSSAYSQNSTRPGGLSVASSQNAAHPGVTSAAAFQNCLRPGTSTAPTSISAVPVSHSPQASHNPLRPGVTTRISPATPLPRSTTPASPGVLSTRSYQTPISRAVGTPPAVYKTLPRPVHVVNQPAALFSGNSPRPVSTTSTSTAPPTVNLHSEGVIRARAPHMRSRVSRPMAPHTTVATPMRSSSQFINSNVPMTAPLANNQHIYNHRTPAPHFQTVILGNVPQSACVPTSPKNGGRHNLTPTSGSTAAQVFCLSDDDN